MNSKEYFEKLDYEFETLKIFKNDEISQLSLFFRKRLFASVYDEIEFDDLNKTVTFRKVEWLSESDTSTGEAMWKRHEISCKGLEIDMKLIKGINMVCSELGWIEEIK